VCLPDGAGCLDPLGHQLGGGIKGLAQLAG
jgi:hypothetical protein